jgi:hypothetical protein
MTPNTPSVQRPVIPEAWLSEVQSWLQPHENATAFLEVDLNASLTFAKTALILTDRRLLAWAEGAKSPEIWALQPGMHLQLSDHAGVGMLELLLPQQRLAVWRFTLGQQAPIGQNKRCFGECERCVQVNFKKGCRVFMRLKPGLDLRQPGFRDHRTLNGGGVWGHEVQPASGWRCASSIKSSERQ